MGIPSYYKKLCDSIPGLLSKTRKGSQRVSHLWVDFNCMVYHCLRRPGARPFAGEETRIEWENALIQDVCKYLKKVVNLVEPTDQVYVGVDGVVPMAKMRQQRLRRFKSHWTATEEIRIGKSEAKERWDTNSITPGTAFMERLGDSLHALRSEGVKWVVSATDEPGEGEHKAMSAMRQVQKRDCHVIYGLDADLILLSLLQDIKELYLFREAVECGEVQYNAFNEEEYRYFSIHTLREHITKGRDSDYLLDYCMAMSLVGNDFLPHSLTLKLKDGGHDILSSMLKDVREGGPLIDRKNMTWSKERLLSIFTWLSEREEAWMEKSVSKKLQQRWQTSQDAVDEWNKTPLRTCDELALVHTKTPFKLLPTWRNVYYDRYLGCVRPSEIEATCREYCRGLDWILKYYTGASVDFEWCFHWFTTPLWADLKAYVTTTPLPLARGRVTEPLKPQEQLALVLPLQSWWLVRDRKLRQLPRLAPQLWPKTFKLFTAGRKQMWECEAQIPLFMPERLRWYIRDIREKTV
jgi:5'-3' exonuclease